MCSSALEPFDHIRAGAAANIRYRLIVKVAKHFECQTKSHEHVAAIAFVDPTHERPALFVIERVKGYREIIKELCGGSDGTSRHFNSFRIGHHLLKPSCEGATFFRVTASITGCCVPELISGGWPCMNRTAGYCSAQECPECPQTIRKVKSEENEGKHQSPHKLFLNS